MDRRIPQSKNEANAVFAIMGFLGSGGLKRGYGGSAAIMNPAETLFCLAAVFASVQAKTML